MINLLPQEEKQKLLSDKKKKLTIILSIIVTVFLLCLMLILLSINFYLLAETDNQKNIFEQAKKENETPDFVNLNGIVKKYNSTLAQVDSFYKQEKYFSNVLEIISGVPAPKNLYLTNFSLNRQKDGKIKVDIAGKSDTRDDLLLFQKNIEANDEIKNPYFSPQSWISPKNVNFSLSFEIDKPNQNENQQ